MDRKFPPEAISTSINSRVPVTPIAVASSAAAPESELSSLRHNVETLTEENQILRSEVASLKRRLAESAAGGAPPSKKARTPAQKKKLFEKWSKALVRESAKHREIFNMFKPDMYEITVKETAAWTPADFHDLFDGHGEKIQPLPDNNPKAIITKLRFHPYEEVKRLFEEVGGAEMAELGYEVQLWRRKRFGGCYQYDTAESRLDTLEVSYNKNRQTLSLVFGLKYGVMMEKEEESDDKEKPLSVVASEEVKESSLSQSSRDKENRENSSIASDDKENRENSSVASELTNPSH